MKNAKIPMTEETLAAWAISHGYIKTSRNKYERKSAKTGLSRFITIYNGTAKMAVEEFTACLKPRVVFKAPVSTIAVNLENGKLCFI